MSKTTAEKIASKDEQIQQLQNQKKQLIQKQKADERKARNNRLFRRHGLFEKYMPDLIVITDEQFEDFIRRGINTSYGQKILAEILAKSGVTAVSASADYTHIIDTDDDEDTPKP
jgi:hypothetical protein